jgi:hypothetical protein
MVDLVISADKVETLDAGDYEEWLLENTPHGIQGFDKPSMSKVHVSAGRTAELKPAECEAGRCKIDPGQVLSGQHHRRLR